MRALYDVEDARPHSGIFGPGDNVPGSRNTLGPTGSGIPKSLPDGTPLTYGRHRVSQILHALGPFDGGKYLIDYILDVADYCLLWEYGETVDERDIATIVDKVSEAWVFKMQIAEEVAARKIEEVTDLSRVPRNMEEVGRDEYNHVDIRMETPAGEEVTFQVKTDVNRMKSHNADYGVEIDTNDKTMVITE
jgi:hypothetical protein